jgi:O-antigen/teichoic acid export membrane protein
MPAAAPVTSPRSTPTLRPTVKAELAATSGLRLRTNVLLTMAGWGVYSLCQWAMLLTLARLGTPHTVGQFGLALSITSPIIMLLGLQLRPLLASETRNQYEFGDFLALRAIGMLASMALIVAITLSITPDATLRVVVISIGAAKALEALSDIYLGVHQRQERMDRFSRALALRGVASLAAFAGAFAVSQLLAAAVAALLFVWAFCLVFHDAPSAKPFGGASGPLSDTLNRLAERRGVIASLAWRAAPLGVVGFLMSLQANIPRYFLFTYFDESVLGHYTAISYLQVAGQVVIASACQSAIPKLAKWSHDGDTARSRDLIRRMMVPALLMGTAGTLLAAIGGEPLLSFLFGPEYSAYPIELVLLGLVGTLQFVAQLFDTLHRACWRFKPLLAVYAASVGALIASCGLMIPSLGVRGAVLALLVAEVVHVAASGYAAAKYLLPQAPAPSLPG